MMEILKKTLLTGIGLAALTKEKVEELAKKLADEAKLSEEEGKKLINDLVKQSDKARKNLEDQVEKAVKETLDKLNIPSRDEMNKLKLRLDKLEREKEEQERTTD